MEEVWVAIKGFDFYEVSNFGRVRNLIYRGSSVKKNVQVLKPYVTKAGYLRVSLSKDKKCYYKLVHRLVALAFLDNSENKPFVDHKDNNTVNAHVNNLQWATPKENNQMAFDRGRNPVKSWLGKSGAEHNKSKKVRCDTLAIIFGSASEAARELGMQQSSISKVCRGELLHKNGLVFNYIQ